MNIPNLKDFEEKKRRLRQFMAENGYDYTILARRDNFAWFTGGGDSKVLRNSDTGFGILVISRENVYFIAQFMDMARIADDELTGLDIEKITLKWQDASREEAALGLCRGGKVAADFDWPGADNRLKDLVQLHYPFTDLEIERYTRVGALCDKMLKAVADRIHPGMTEHEIEAEILFEYGKENMTPKVLLVGSDERIAKYRHPNASPKKVEKLVLLHPGAEKWGLHANITRMVYFGDKLPEDLQHKYDLLNLCEAQAMAMCRPGVRYHDILEERRRIFRESGCEEEFFNHYPGVITGYYFVDAQPIINNEAVVERIAYDWFITVTGAKVEELSISDPKGAKLLSATGVWPVKEYCYKGFKYNLPIIYQR